VSKTTYFAYDGGQDIQDTSSTGASQTYPTTAADDSTVTDAYDSLGRMIEESASGMNVSRCS
jgi:hypothetical protein